MGKVIAVNQQDKALEEVERFKAHQVKGILHRGFIIFIFNSQGELLLLKRSQRKKLWPLFWDGCCSHPHQGENYVQAGERRLSEELGFSCSLKYIDKFYYQAVYKNIGSEEEICAILEGQYNGQVKPISKEIADYRWVNLEDLQKEIQESPEKFAPWFPKALSRHQGK